MGETINIDDLRVLRADDPEFEINEHRLDKGEPVAELPPPPVPVEFDFRGNPIPPKDPV